MEIKNGIEIQEYKLRKSYVTTLKLCLVVFIGFLLLGLSLPFIPDSGDSFRETIVTTVFCTIVFGFFSIVTWRTLKAYLIADLSADSLGLWPSHKTRKEGLVKWKDIASFKERSLWQCLDLFDAEGNKVLQVNYKLDGFNQLRERLTKHLIEGYQSCNNKLQNEFSKSYWYHALHILGIVLFAWLGTVLGGNGNILLGYGIMSFLVFAVIYEYLKTPFKVTINESRVVISYPYKKHQLPLRTITSVDLTDEFHKGNRLPEVQVWVSGVVAEKSRLD
ncbi:hypothetical protein KJ365_16600 [Glaciecola sp. XM2]|uniref:hypothetical protein n=1 Tax=Glaciecola sp. XM2 TaxID=1914931 RepID=UPI001BDE5369|nr:hypothetical protein [Glaciecola sp. XM2]MBT1452504.1 hypothetical protein [Glaciecola sp. XM2]